MNCGEDDDDLIAQRNIEMELEINNLLKQNEEISTKCMAFKNKIEILELREEQKDEK